MSYLGKGIYTVSEASRLTGVKKDTIRRWVSGYKHSYDNKISLIAPVFERDYSAIDKSVALSFVDLIELQFIDSFRKYGVRWQIIRKCAEIAETMLNSTHPFASKRFYTDRKTILFKFATETGDNHLIDLMNRQYAFEPLLTPILVECLDFNIDEIAAKWWPFGKNNHIVVDPERNFGKPVIDPQNIPTSIIYAAWKAEKSSAVVADWYEIDESLVVEAIEFEKKLAA